MVLIFTPNYMQCGCPVVGACLQCFCSAWKHSVKTGLGQNVLYLAQNNCTDDYRFNMSDMWIFFLPLKWFSTGKIPLVLHPDYRGVELCCLFYLEHYDLHVNIMPEPSFRWKSQKPFCLQVLVLCWLEICTINKSFCCQQHMIWAHGGSVEHMVHWFPELNYNWPINGENESFHISVWNFEWVLYILLYNTNIRVLLEGFEEFEFRRLGMGDKTLCHCGYNFTQKYKKTWKIYWWVQEMTAFSVFCLWI